MKKLLNPPVMSSAKKRISVRIPKTMLTDIDSSLKAENLGLREKSLWIEDAINKLFQKNYSKELILENWIEVGGGNKLIQVSVDSTTMRKVNATKEIIEQQTEGAKDLKSAIVRTAILQKLLENRIMK